MGFLSLCKHIVEKTDNSSSGNSLMMAADGGNLYVVQFLLENTREVNLQNYQDPNKGWTPLHYAADKGHFDICANLSQQTISGATPLHKAGQRGHLKVCKPVGDCIARKQKSC